MKINNKYFLFILLFLCTNMFVIGQNYSSKYGDLNTYEYLDEEICVYYAHTSEKEKKHYLAIAKDNLCIVIFSGIEDSISLFIDSELIYEGRLIKTVNHERLVIPVKKQEISNCPLLTIYSHKSQTKMEIIIDKRFPFISLNWTRNPEYLKWDLGYFYSIGI